MDAPSSDSQTQQRFTRLKWVTTLVPAAAVFAYETLRHNLLDRTLPTAYGNLLVGLLALLLAYGFSRAVFGVVERLQAASVMRGREVAALQAAAHERERLGHELHDGLAQVIALLLLRLDIVGGLVADGRDSEALEELEDLRTLAGDLSEEVREAISGLRAHVDERGLAAALEEYLAAFEERHGISTDLVTYGAPLSVPPAADYQLFRIAQEALANVRQHAGATRVRVTLGFREPAALDLAIEDDGRGFDPSAASSTGQRSFGLATMRERAASLGGALALQSTPGTGTRVVAAVPLHRRAEEVKRATLAHLAG